MQKTAKNKPFSAFSGWCTESAGINFKTAALDHSATHPDNDQVYPETGRRQARAAKGTPLCRFPPTIACRTCKCKLVRQGIIRVRQGFPEPKR